MSEKKISKVGEDAINTETMLQLQQIGRDMAKATTVDAMDKASKKFFKSAKTIKKTRDKENIRKGRDPETGLKIKNKKTIRKSRGGMINGNDLVASYYEKG